jgi:hypothetical protein
VRERVRLALPGLREGARELSLANYRPHRSLPSKNVVESLGLSTRNGRNYPDLVFGFSPPSSPAAADVEELA